MTLKLSSLNVNSKSQQLQVVPEGHITHCNLVMGTCFICQTLVQPHIATSSE